MVANINSKISIFSFQMMIKLIFCVFGGGEGGYGNRNLFNKMLLIKPKNTSKLTAVLLCMLQMDVLWMSKEKVYMVQDNSPGK